MSVIELNDVHRSYGHGHEVLSGVSFAVDEGEVVGLLGVNGAGKTTLINIIMGMLRPQAGTVRVLGCDPRDDPVALKRRIGFVSEDQVLPPALSVDAVLDLHRELFPTWDAALEGRLRQRFRFEDRAKVGTLSKGQTRQLALLCAVAHRPELLVLDEPGGSLDPAMRRGFLETSIQLLAESGTTILFSSHYMSDVERIAGRAVLINDRRVLLDDDLEALREEHVLVVVPRAEADVSRLEADPRCLKARIHVNTVHAVFTGRAEEVEGRLKREHGVARATCRHVPLEELFVELVGEDS
ncbi:MAG: ABC transporter ATP-binding protein [Gemmatimonadetes bacterium]|jgi:ABC-2 type transport system ATP-binding protein|nr:ABC transporter ATP-binding protein [Gemmatimonadota bacterium]